MPAGKQNHHTQILKYITENGNQSEIRRANLILLYGEGSSTREIAARVDLSPSRVRYWLREYRAKGLSVFPDNLIDAGLGSLNHFPEATPPSPELELGEEGQTAGKSSPEMLVSEVCNRYEVDIAHARFVADLTLLLFDISEEIHQLPPESRNLAEIAGVLHNVGLATNPEEHDEVGRDILLGTNLIGFDDVEQRILAFSTALHRKPYKPKRTEREANSIELSGERQDQALGITSLLRIADGLDYSGDQSTKLKAYRVEPEAILLSLSGPSATQNAQRALVKADMWQSIYKIPFEFEVDGERVTFTRSPNELKSSPIPIRELKSPGLSAEDYMAEAGRKILRFHFYRMVENDPGTRLGEDIEALHDMRVATRRMRSAVPIFAPYFDKRTIGNFKRELRKTGRALGRVRDLDVFMYKARSYLDTAERVDPSELDPLLSNWQAEREQARGKMLKLLESRRYAQFLQQFGEFLETPGAGVKEEQDGGPSANRVFQAVPHLIYQRDSVVRGYADILEDAPLDTLHALRIDIKRFRYALEFFEEVLDQSARMVIKQAVTLQDHLGDLHDADVACKLLIEFLDQWRETERRDLVNIDGITHYLVTKQSELRSLVETFPTAWEEFNSLEVRANLAQAVSKL